jgi:hypothetical protein
MLPDKPRESLEKASILPRVFSSLAVAYAGALRNLIRKTVLPASFLSARASPPIEATRLPTT